MARPGDAGLSRRAVTGRGDPLTLADSMSSTESKSDINKCGIK